MLDIEEQSGVSVVRMRHGKVNALDIELLRAITAAMRDLPPSTAVVLTGTDRNFCAGVDLHRIVDGGPRYVREYLPTLSETFLAIFDRPGPTVAAVNGHAIAGGCVIAAACDARLMSQGKIGLTELTVGVPFPTSALEIMRHTAGPAAQRLVLGAPLLDPLQAKEIGLVDTVAEPDALLDAAVRTAQALGRIPADVFAFSKNQLRRPARERIAARSVDDETVTEIWASAATRDAIAGFLTDLDNRRR